MCFFYENINNKMLFPVGHCIIFEMCFSCYLMKVDDADDKHPVEMGLIILKGLPRSWLAFNHSRICNQ